MYSFTGLSSRLSKKISLVVLVAVVAAGWALIPSQSVQAAESDGEAGLNVAVVDMIKVLTECQANVEHREQNIEKQKEIKEVLDKLSDEADTIRQELETAISPGTKEHEEQLLKWFEKQAMIKAYEEAKKKAMTVETQAWMEQLYQDALEEISRVALKDGYDLVLDKEEIDMSPTSPGELEDIIRGRDVLFCTASLDITAQIIENLDRAYESKKIATD